MEKQINSKVVDMKVASKKEAKEEKQKLTYEQLNDACIQLSQQNRQLIIRNRELESFAMNKRLDYLFKVLEFSNKFSSDFVISCSSEIEQAMTIPQDIEEESKKD